MSVITKKKPSTKKKTKSNPTATASITNTVRKPLNIENHYLHLGRKRNSDNESRRNAILYERDANGLTIKEIAAKIGISTATVSRSLTKLPSITEMNHTSDERKKTIDEDMRKIILHESNANGLTNVQIAAIVGTSQWTVRKVLKENTITDKKIRKPLNRWKPVDEKMCNTIIHESKVNGLTQAKIAAMVGTNQPTVSNILKKYALISSESADPVGEKKLVNDTIRKDTIHEYKVNSHKQKEIATKIGISKETVSRVLSEYSAGNGGTYKPRKKGKPVDDNMRKTILHEYKVNGLKQKEIAAMIGTCPSTVSVVLKKFRENMFSVGPVDMERESMMIDENTERESMMIEEDTERELIIIEENTERESMMNEEDIKKESMMNEDIKKESMMNEEDELELIHKVDHNPLRIAEGFRMRMINRVCKTTFYKMMKKFKLFP